MTIITSVVVDSGGLGVDIVTQVRLSDTLHICQNYYSYDQHDTDANFALDPEHVFTLFLCPLSSSLPSMGHIFL